MKAQLLATARSMEALACMLEGVGKLTAHVESELGRLADDGTLVPIDVQRIAADLVTYTKASMTVIDAVMSIASATQDRLPKDAPACSNFDTVKEPNTLRAVLEEQSNTLSKVVCSGEAFKRTAQENLALATTIATCSATPTEIVASMLARISNRGASNRL